MSDITPIVPIAGWDAAAAKDKNADQFCRAAAALASGDIGWDSAQVAEALAVNAKTRQDLEAEVKLVLERRKHQAAFESLDANRAALDAVQARLLEFLDKKQKQLQALANEESSLQAEEREAARVLALSKQAYRALSISRRDSSRYDAVKKHRESADQSAYALKVKIAKSPDAAVELHEKLKSAQKDAVSAKATEDALFEESIRVL